jgi:hypothetical protein
MQISQHLKSEGNIARISQQLVPLLERRGGSNEGVKDIEWLSMMKEIGELRIEQEQPYTATSGTKPVEPNLDHLVCLFFR